MEEKNRQVNFDLLNWTGHRPELREGGFRHGTDNMSEMAAAGLYNGTYGGSDFQPRVGLAWTPAFLGGKSVHPICFQHVILS